MEVSRGLRSSAGLSVTERMGEDGFDGLRDWLMEKLEPICEAEPGTLADYVLSLLKNDVPRKKLAEMCEKELFDFLDHNTQALPPPNAPAPSVVCTRPLLSGGEHGVV